MSKIQIIARRELNSYFDSLMAYIMIVVFLGFTGFFTWLYGSDVFYVGQASMGSFFGIAYWTLFFFIPALTMKQIAEERKTGTIELLLTKSVTDWQVIVGKFLSTFYLILIALVLTLPYYITIANLGPVDHGAVWCGYLGLLLMSAAYISIGILCSSVTHNQIVAFLLSLMVGILFQILFGMISTGFTGILGELFHYLDLRSHYDAVTRGVIDTKDLIYFLTIPLFALTAAETSLASRNVN